MVKRVGQVGGGIGKRAIEIEGDNVEGKIGHGRPLASTGPHGK
jgi:hypothetical protein